jgi:hypothetical protein
MGGITDEIAVVKPSPSTELHIAVSWLLISKIWQRGSKIAENDLGQPPAHYQSGSGARDNAVHDCGRV